MFVGISITELLGWYVPVVSTIFPLLLALCVFYSAGLPLLSWAWAFIDRGPFTNNLQRRITFAILAPVLQNCNTYKGQRISSSSWRHTEELLAGTKQFAKIKVSPGWVNCSASAVNSRGCCDDWACTVEVTATAKDITKGLNSMDSSEPQFLTVCAGLILCLLIWPAFIVIASLAVPLYLFRAARDGQKLAIKVGKHIADAEVHVDGKADTGG
jgi:hypothetical protein